MSPPHSQLPLELEYAILGWLKKDKPTAASCSLVCRSWRAVCQSLILDAVKINAYVPVNGQRRHQPDRIPNFLHFIQTNSSIASHIRELSFNGNHDGVIPLPMFLAALGELPHLRILWLQQVHIDGTTATDVARDKPGTQQVGRSLDELNIILCTFPRRRLSDMLSIVCFFAEIGHLAINDDDWLGSSDSEFYSRECTLMVRSLRLYDLLEACTSAICSMVRRASLGGHLTSMTFRPWELGAVRPLASLVRDAGPSLEALEIHLSHGMQGVSPTEMCKILDLSTCMGLRTLKLRLSANGAELYARPRMIPGWLPVSFCACADLISSHRQALSMLRTVQITICSIGSWCGGAVTKAMEAVARDEAAWQPLDDALMNMRSLGRLEFTIVDRYQEMTDEQRINLRSNVEAGLSGVLGLHKGAHDFFHFTCGQ